MNTSGENKYDLSTFMGRYQYFLEVTNWRLCFKSDKELDEAKKILKEHSPTKDATKLWTAKCLYDSAFHPDTGDKQNVCGRMCFQVPGGMFLTGAMLTFYRTNTSVIFWQWANQSFNAFVNYTNRNANSSLSTNQLCAAYFSATSVAILSALGLKKVLAFKAPPMAQRFVPFLAVAAANLVNIPLMRQVEIQKGIQLFDEEQHKATSSKVAAVKGISEVVLSRIIMAGPGMTLLPVIMNKLERFPVFKRSIVNISFQTFMIGAILTFMTPASCAIFNQKCSISSDTLRRFESSAYEDLQQKYGSSIPSHLYFNKGL